MESDERLGCSPAIYRLQNGCLDLKKSFLIQEIAQCAYYTGPCTEDLAYLFVDSQVGVALTVTSFRVSQGGMPYHLPVNHLILGCRQWGDRLCQHFELAYQQAHLPAARPDQIASRLDKVSDVEMIFEALHFCLTQLVDTEKELQAPATILNVSKRQLAHQADGAQATAQYRGEHFRAACRFILLEFADGFGIIEVYLGAGRVWFMPLFTHLLHFFKTNSFQFVKFHWLNPFNKMSLPCYSRGQVSDFLEIGSAYFCAGLTPGFFTGLP